MTGHPVDLETVPLDHGAHNELSKGLLVSFTRLLDRMVAVGKAA